MVLKIVFPGDRETSSQKLISHLIDCDRIVYSENESGWTVIASKNNSTTGEYSFKFEEGGGHAFLMEGGKTVDRLPRR